MSFAGSLRRWQETVGTIRIVASSKQPEVLVEHLLRFPVIIKVEDKTEYFLHGRTRRGREGFFEGSAPGPIPSRTFLGNGI